ncbi:baseplate J/gp47 family protein [Methanobrevibacter sp.]
MALEEVSFINIAGEEISLTGLVNQMIEYYQLKLEVGETKITDFNEGSEIRNLLEAYAVLIYNILEDVNELSKSVFLQTSEGVWLDRIGELPFIDLPRISGEYAKGEVTFTLAEAQETDIVILVDTIVTDSETNIDFVTDNDAIIIAGETSVDVTVTCLSEGIEGNSKSGNVTIIEADTGIDTNLVSVINNERFSDGADYEEDEDYRNRLLNNVQAEGFGTIGYYTSLGENVKGVHDVKLIRDENYTRKVLVNGLEKPTPDDVLLNALAEYTNTDNIILNHNFIVDKPSYFNLDLNITVNVVNDMNTDTIINLVKSFINGTSFVEVDNDGLNIGESLKYSDLVETLSILDNIVSVESITNNNEEFTEITVNDDAVINPQNINVTLNIQG